MNPFSKRLEIIDPVTNQPIDMDTKDVQSVTLTNPKAASRSNTATSATSTATMLTVTSAGSSQRTSRALPIEDFDPAKHVDLSVKQKLQSVAQTPNAAAIKFYDDGAFANPSRHRGVGAEYHREDDSESDNTSMPLSLSPEEVAVFQGDDTETLVSILEDLDIYRVDKRGLSAVDIIHENPSAEIIKTFLFFLLDYYRKRAAERSRDKVSIMQTITILKKKGLVIKEIKDSEGRSILHAACLALNAGNVRLLGQEEKRDENLLMTTSIVDIKRILADVLTTDAEPHQIKGKQEIIDLLRDPKLLQTSSRQYDSKVEFPNLPTTVQRIIEALILNPEELFRQLDYLYYLASNSDTESEFTDNEMDFLGAHVLQQLAFGIYIKQISLDDYDNFKRSFFTRYNTTFETVLKSKQITGAFNSDVLSVAAKFAADESLEDYEEALLLVELMELDDTLELKKPGYLVSDRTVDVLLRHFGDEYSQYVAKSSHDSVSRAATMGSGDSPAASVASTPLHAATDIPADTPALQLPPPAMATVPVHPVAVATPTITTPLVSSTPISSLSPGTSRPTKADNKQSSMGKGKSKAPVGKVHQWMGKTSEPFNPLTALDAAVKDFNKQGRFRLNR